LSAVFLYTAPVWIILVLPFVEREKVTSRKILGSVLVVIGLYIIYLGFPNLLKFLLGIACGLSYAGVILISRKLQINGVRDWELIASQSFWSLPFTALFVRSFSIPSIEGGLYMGIFATFVPYYFFYKGMRKSDSLTASIISALEPVFTILLAFFILDQLLNIRDILGTL
ncbi:DMT family transporter, partial [Acidianus sp. RZ1]